MEPSARGRIVRRLGELRRDEGGQALIFIALTMFTLFFFLALSVNMAKQAGDRLEIQNDADAVALTGATWLARGFNFLAAMNVDLSSLAAVRAMSEGQGAALEACAAGGGADYCSGVLRSVKAARGGAAGESARIEALGAGLKLEEKFSIGRARILANNWGSLVANEMLNVAIYSKVDDLAVYPVADFDSREADGEFGPNNSNNNIRLYVDIPPFPPATMTLSTLYAESQFVVAGVCKGRSNAPLLGGDDVDNLPRFDNGPGLTQFATAQGRAISIQYIDSTDVILDMGFVGRLVPFTGGRDGFGAPVTPTQIVQSSIVPYLDKCLPADLADPANEAILNNIADGTTVH